MLRHLRKDYGAQRTCVEEWSKEMLYQELGLYGDYAIRYARKQEPQHRYNKLCCERVRKA